MRDSWAIVGAGAQGRIVLEALQAQHPLARAFFLDDREEVRASSLAGIPVKASSEGLANHRGPAVLAIGDNPTRLRIAARGDALGVRWQPVIHPSATISPSARIGAGAVVLAGAVVHSGARVGDHAIVNTAVIVEHDCTLGRGCSISPGVCMGGRVDLGEGSFVSVGASIAPRMIIGAGAIVGAGAVVISNVPEATVCFGVPARFVRPVRREDWEKLG
jgi:sugar O-acyltransferase (sialic acid O-acetyltransferase NeuD family)